MSYIDQFQRVERFLARIENQNRSQTEYEDDLWSFFQNCWHLRDWIFEDTTVPAKIRNTVKKSIKRVPSLMMSADLANRSKHSTLTKSIKKDAKILAGRINLEIADSPDASSARISYAYTIHTAKPTGNPRRKRHDALTVARQAVHDWRKYLSTKGLSC